MVNGIDDTVGNTASICFCLSICQYPHTLILIRPRTGTTQHGEQAALMIVIHILVQRAELPASVSQNREPVQENTVTLTALVRLQQTRDTHRLIIVHHRNSGKLRVRIVEAQLVVMNHQLFPSDALVQQMIRNKLVQHIHLISIVIIIQRPLHVVIQPGLAQIVTHILHTDVSGRLAQQLLPQTVRFHKQRITIVPVFRNRSGAGRIERSMRRQVFHSTCQIQHLPHIVTESIQRIYQSAGNYQT